MRATRDRPTFLQRFPDGVEGDEIYQKHIAKKRPEHVQSTPIVFPSKRTGDAIRPTVPADLVWAANLGTVTFHTWPTIHPDNDHPPISYASIWTHNPAPRSKMFGAWRSTG